MEVKVEKYNHFNVLNLNRPKLIQPIKGDNSSVNEITSEMLSITKSTSGSKGNHSTPLNKDNVIVVMAPEETNSEFDINNIYFQSILIKNKQEHDDSKTTNPETSLNFTNQSDVQITSSSVNGNPEKISILPEHYRKGLESDNIHNKFIFSMKKFHPLSIFTGTKKYMSKLGLLEYPSPNLIDHNEWTNKPDYSKDSILNGNVIDDKHGLLLVDKEIMKKFRGIIGDLITQIIKAAFGVKISMKVKFFEPKSTLQRIADYWSFAPVYLNKAADPSLTPLERIKHVITFAVSGLYISTKSLKPFNPVVGETFEGEFENGAKVYLEQVSGSPVISRFLIIDKNFRFSGYFEFGTKIESFGSILNVYQKGPCVIEFPQLKEKITYCMPTIRLLNAASEENKSTVWVNSIVVCDPKNSLKGVLRMSCDKTKLNNFEGVIFEFPFNSDYKFKYETEFDFGKKFDVKKTKLPVVNKITGSWLGGISFDGIQSWDINVDIPCWIRPSDKCLPSDGRFREDLIWLYRSFNCARNEKERSEYENLSQEWKIMIEKLQREERDLRAKYRNRK